MSLLNRLRKRSYIPSLVLLLLIMLLNCFIVNGFTTQQYITAFCTANAPAMIISIGLSLVIIGGGIDISVGAIVAVTNTVFVTLYGDLGYSLGMAVLLCILFAALLGAINGVVIGVLRVTPLLATFATQTLFSGLALWILPQPSVSGTVPKAAMSWYSSRFMLLPTALWIVAAIWLISYLVIRSKYGLGMFAIGKDSMKAYISAIPVSTVQFILYTFSGMCAGIAGLCITFNTGGGDASTGLSLTMTCIAGCVIGGVNLAGGIGSSLGAVFGAAFLQMIIVTVFSMQINPYMQNMIQALVMLVGTLGTVILGLRSNRTK